MHGDWFYPKDYGIFDHEIKATERSPPDKVLHDGQLHGPGALQKGN